MDFARAVAIEIRLEGGPRLVRDTGGLTKYGISQRAFPNLDIASLTLDHAEQIYHDYYWAAANCDNVLDELKLAVFDCAINQGVAYAVNLYNECPHLSTYLDARAEKYRSLAVSNPAKYERYLQGWLNRLNRVYDYSMSPASYATPADYDPTAALVPPSGGVAAPDVIPAPVEPPQVIEASYTPDLRPGAINSGPAAYIPGEPYGASRMMDALPDMRPQSPAPDFEDFAGGGGLLYEAKSLWQSKIAWGSVGLGGASTVATVQSDPSTLHLLEQLAHHPTVWFALGIVGLVAYIIYCRWHDHGRGHWPI